MGVQRVHVLGADDAQIGLEHADRQVDTLHAKTYQAALLGQGLAEVGVAGADEDRDIAGAEGHAFERHVADVRVVVRHPADHLQPLEEQLAGLRQHALEHLQLTRQAGVHVGLEGLAQAELEIAVYVDEVAEVEVEIRDRQHAADAVHADLQVQALDRVLDAVQGVLEPCRRRGRHLGHQVGQPSQADRRDQTAGAGQFELEVEGRQIDVEQVEQTQVGLHANAQHVRVVVDVQRCRVAADRDVQPMSAIGRAEVGVGERHRITAEERAVEAQHDVLGIERQVRCRADQADQVGSGLDRVEGQRVNLEVAAQRGLEHRECEVEVVDRKADRALVGRVGLVDLAVVVAVGSVRPVDAGKGIDVLAGDHHRFGVHLDRDAGGVEGHILDDALLESQPTLHAQDAGDVDRGFADRGQDLGVVEVEQHRRATGADRITRFGTARGEVSDPERVVGAVDADDDVLELELESIAHADEPDQVGRPLERGELGARRHQQRHRIGQQRLGIVVGLGREQA